MATLEQVVNQMQAAGLPLLPHGHPLLDGQIHRFGPKKKAWYVLRELSLRNGRTVVTGSFGTWQGTDNHAVPVRLDWDGISDDERAEIERKQAEYQRAEEDKKRREAELAANRARQAWSEADQTRDVEGGHPYLERKRVGEEGTRMSAKGELLIPIRLYSHAGAVLVGLQRILPDGAKRYSSNMDRIGGACLLGALKADAPPPVIAIGEGYATCETVRMATDFTLPVMVAFDAGNLLPVAQQLRTDFPATPLLFLADDDSRVLARLREFLQREFDASWEPQVDGNDHEIESASGDLVRVRATWRADATGTDYIEADVRAGRRVALRKFENAGISRARAAARAVGNATVVWPCFADRTDDSWSDFNDLYLAESIDAVRDQVQAALSRALRGEADAVPAYLDAAPLPDGSPLPSDPPAAPGQAASFTLDWALEHCALVQGTTDVWDALNKIKMKRPAFAEMVGKAIAAEWAEHPRRRMISPRNLPRLVKGVAHDDGGAGDNIVMMLDRYTLLYGTKTVWDADKRQVIPYDAMALARGSDLASRWIGHPMHREIDLDKLVFDPTQTVDLDTHINMFAGFPLTPKKDDTKAGLALALLKSLCASEPNCDEVFEWVLSWLAYPLQHPGAKMQSALLFFGEKQGTGKSLFFEGIVKPIYGEHGATGGQHQLDAQYTHWRSQKLYVLFEEILSRQDKYSHFGLVKHMITGRDQTVTQKFKDDRTEANHMNVVMLSNEFQAVPLEPDDRRFLVVEVRNPLHEKLRLAIKAELDAGTSLIEAFYAFLLEYPLGDFDRFTKPVMTPSKERMINFGRPDWEAFYLTWFAGELAVPYCSCLSNDLYVVYARYCNKYGFRPLTITKFAELIAQRLKKDRQWIDLGGTGSKKLLTVFHVPQPEDAEPQSLSIQCKHFHDNADIKGSL